MRRIHRVYRMESLPRCEHCGQILPDEEFPFGKLLLYLAIPGVFVPFLIFTLTTVVSWMDGGNSFTDPVLLAAHRKLIMCFWLNLKMVWHALRYNVI